MSQIVRLAAHVVKKHVYKTETTSWQVTIRDAIDESLLESTISHLFFTFEEKRIIPPTSANLIGNPARNL